MVARKNLGAVVMPILQKTLLLLGAVGLSVQLGLATPSREICTGIINPKSILEISGCKNYVRITDENGFRFVFNINSGRPVIGELLESLHASKWLVGCPKMRLSVGDYYLKLKLYIHYVKARLQIRDERTGLALFDLCQSDSKIRSEWGAKALFSAFIPASYNYYKATTILFKVVAITVDGTLVIWYVGREDFPLPLLD